MPSRGGFIKLLEDDSAGVTSDAGISEEEDIQVDVDNVEEPADAFQQEEISYSSKLPRNVFACAMDRAALCALAVKVASFIESGKDPESDCAYIAYDEYRECDACRTVMTCNGESALCEVQSRSVVLHTLTHGSLIAAVIDFICPTCSSVVFFDGHDSALFSGASKSAIYTREIIDFWMYVVAMLGSTFRSAYEASKQLSRSTSVVQRRLGGALSCNRRQASIVFGYFLRSLSYPEDRDVASLFHCSQCEIIGPDGIKTMRAIVLDGTAIGILGDLPNVERRTLTIHPVKNSGGSQFVIKYASLRNYIDYFLCTAKSGVETSFFEIRTPQAHAIDSLHKMLVAPEETSSVFLAVRKYFVYRFTWAYLLI